mgnify:CR=1 FL=1
MQTEYPRASSDTPVQAPPRALVVDLDDTLVSTDTFMEQALVVLKAKPMAIFRMLVGLAKGRAHLKALVAAHTPLALQDLPYNDDVLDFLRHEKAAGRQIILATAADSGVAQTVADHLGIFDAVLSSTPGNNLKGPAKAAAIGDHLKETPFDYIGDSTADRPIWQAAGRAHVVAADTATARKRAGDTKLEQVFVRPGLTPRVFLKAMRVHQWAKNVLVFVPLILSHTYDEPARVWAALVAFLCLGLCASGTYLWNDLLDLADDRAHATKRMRPLASGRMTIREGVLASVALIGLGLGTALVLNGVVLMLGISLYIALTLSYSLVIKRKMVADVLLLAGLFLYRILLGGLATGVVISDWLMAFSIFFFLSLGLAKRLTDLPPDSRNNPALIPGRGYRGTDAPVLAALGAGSALSSIIILSLYINDSQVMMLYDTPQALWGICLVLLYWVCRVWVLVYRGELPHDPIVFALKDKISRILGVIILLIVLFARF